MTDRFYAAEEVEVVYSYAYLGVVFSSGGSFIQILKHFPFNH